MRDRRPPPQEEILFAPLTGLEVQGFRLDGNVIYVKAKVSVNLMSLTMEKVIGKRKTMLEDMLPGLKAELKQNLEKESLATAEGVKRIVGWFSEELYNEKTGPLRHEAKWYNSDANLEVALKDMLQTRRDFDVDFDDESLPKGGAKRVEKLVQLTRDERSDLGFLAAAYEPGVDTAIKDLVLHKDETGRYKVDTTYAKKVEGIKRLAQLEPAGLAHHVRWVLDALSQKVQVRDEAVKTLAKLRELEPPEAREEILAAVVKAVPGRCKDPKVAEPILTTLRQLDCLESVILPEVSVGL